VLSTLAAVFAAVSIVVGLKVLGDAFDEFD